MKAPYAFAAVSSLLVRASAVPFNKPRDIIWVTATQEIYQIVDVVETVWVSWSLPASTTAIQIVTISDFAPSPAVTSSIQFVTESEFAPTTSTLTASTLPTPAASTPSLTQTMSPVVQTSSSFLSTVTTTANFYSITMSSSTPEASTTAAVSATGISVPEMSYGMAASRNTYTGDITYYATGLGSCGITSGYYDHTVAISHVIMDAYNPGDPNDNPLCGKQIMIVYNGQQFPGTVVDRCTGCAQGDLDLSEGFFSMITGDTAAGRIEGIQWSWA